MTLREAIDGFQMDNVLLVGQEDGIVERNIMAIKALEVMDSQRWIPVEERLPDEAQEVLVTRKQSKGYYVTCDEYDWDYCAWASDSDDIVAWMPMPEQYKPETLGFRNKWDATDEVHGEIWGCEKCGNTFCSKCFIDRYGSEEYMRMMQDSNEIYCPDCWANRKEN